MNEDQTTLTKWLGNVTEDTEFTFEYKLKSLKDLLKLQDVDMTKI